jgi:hypothetical protein
MVSGGLNERQQVVRAIVCDHHYRDEVFCVANLNNAAGATGLLMMMRCIQLMLQQAQFMVREKQINRNCSSRA